MSLVLEILSFLIYLFLLIVILGLIRPWYVLWFIDRKNRWKVLKIYGLITGILILFKIMLAYHF